MKEARIKKLLLQYNDILAELGNARVIKSGKLVADYGEYLASKKLKLKLDHNSSNKGWDAKGVKNHKKYEIKTRKATTKHPNPTRFAVNWETLNADYVILVKLGINWEIKEMIKLTIKKAREFKGKNALILTKKFEDFSILKKHST